MNDPGFKCAICGKPVGDSYVCLDRRTESLATSEQGEKVMTTVNIACCQTMFIYCSNPCWDAHAPNVAAELQVAKPYPSFGLIAPCSRCGGPVNRTVPYLNYTVSELKFIQTTPYLSAQCLDDRDFAILCTNCEEPDTGLGAEATEILTTGEKQR